VSFSRHWVLKKLSEEVPTTLLLQAFNARDQHLQVIRRKIDGGPSAFILTAGCLNSSDSRSGVNFVTPVTSRAGGGANAALTMARVARLTFENCFEILACHDEAA